MNSRAMHLESLDSFQDPSKIMEPETLPIAEEPVNQYISSAHFKISTEPERDHLKSKYIRYNVAAELEPSLSQPEVTAARMEDELSRLQHQGTSILEDSLMLPQDLYNKQIDESFRLRKLEQSLEDYSRDKQSSLVS